MSPKSENKENKFEQFISVASAQKFFQGLPENCKKNILQVLMADKSAVSKSIEIVDDVPELERENYKIDKYTTLKAKLQLGRKENRDSNGIVYIRKDLGEGAYVIEYLAGVSKKYIGEQKFNFLAVAKLGLRSKCMKDREEAEKILSKEKIRNRSDLSGRYDPKKNIIEDVGCWNNYRLEDKNLIGITDNFETFYSDTDPDISHSIRLVKGR